MARTPVSPATRAANVNAAVADLQRVTIDATAALAAYGPADTRTLRAWEIVEAHGATVHRNSRLLAGKSKGG
jgi:hypothetical protein